MKKRQIDRAGLVGRAMQLVFLVCGIAVLLMMAVVTVAILAEGVTVFRRVGLHGFLFGKEWDPNGTPASYGIWALTLTTMYMVGASMLIAAPLGILCGLFMLRAAPSGLKAVLIQLSALMGNIPSVVYGLLGIALVLPGIQQVFGRPYGEGLLAVILMMSAMFVPRVANMAMLDIAEVPREVELAAMALGATEVEAWWYASLRHVRANLLISVLMQVGIMAGETLAVMMVAGNVANMPGLFKSVQTLATALGAEAFSTGSEQWHVLFSIALVTFIFGGLLFGIIRFVNSLKRGGKQ